MTTCTRPILSSVTGFVLVYSLHLQAQKLAGVFREGWGNLALYL